MMAFSIRDRLNGFGALTLENNELSAQRNFSLIFSGGLPRAVPEDFTLFRIGEYDTASGVFKAIVPPEFIMDGVQARSMFDTYGKDDK